jgi:tetratricopeptide (TPR) repeat protein
MRKWCFGISFVLLCFFVLASSAAPAQGKTDSPKRNIRGLQVQSVEEALTLPEEEIDLGTATLLLAREAWKDFYGITIDVRVYQRHLDEMAKALRKRIGKNRKPEKVVAVINRYLFEELGFRWTPLDEKDPKEFFLNFVLDQKKGTCLGLSLLYLALGERLKLPLYGVVVPGHFFVRYSDGKERFNIETTAGGTIFLDDYAMSAYSVPKDNPFYLKSLGKRKTIGVLYVNLGTVYLTRDRYEKALTYFTRAVEINPNDTEAYFGRGGIYYLKGFYEEAIENYSKAIEINPWNAKMYYARGNAYTAVDFHNRAIEDYSRAIKINPEFVEAYFDRGNAYLSQGLYDQAIADYTKAIKIRPDFAEAYHNRGNAYRKRELPDRAIADYNKAIALNPEYAEAYNNRGLAYFDKGFLEQALSDFNKALQLNPGYVEAYYNRGNIYLAQGFLEKAVEDYNRAIEMNSEYVEAYFFRGTVHLLLSHSEEASADYKKVLEREPGFVYLLLGIIQDVVGSPREAREAYRIFVEYVSPKYEEFVKLAKERIRELEKQSSQGNRK